MKLWRFLHIHFHQINVMELQHDLVIQWAMCYRGTNNEFIMYYSSFKYVIEYSLIYIFYYI